MGSENEIKAYIKSALENENFLNYEITLTTGNTQSNGYSSNISFATVLGTTVDGTKEIELAVKISKKNFIKRLKSLYQRETYFYEAVLPAFIRFQTDNNVKETFKSVPKFYKAISGTSIEVLVLENLRKAGYALYDRQKPLDINHLKLVLREYGKLHALSFALREKRRIDFERIVADYDDGTLELLDAPFRKMMQLRMKITCDILKKQVDAEIYNKCMEIYQNGADKVMVGVLESKEPESAILHGDCWNSNFVYKYKDENEGFPLKVAILDWQLSRLHSPVLDLSYFLYSTCSSEQLEHFDELLDIYYNSFSAFLEELGCDPGKLFPYSSLQRHWKKYSVFGLLIVMSFLHVILCEEEDSPHYDEDGDGNDIAEKVMDVSITNESELQRRLVAIFSHYFKYN